MNNLLSIAIPTYNRNDILKKNIQDLLIQSENKVEIIIYDNCSDIPIIETLSEELSRFSHLKIIRNRANVGLSGNLIKCFEGCTTKWLWIIGDDDKIINKSIDIVVEYVKKYDDFTYINFNSDLVDKNAKQKRLVDYESTGINEYFEKADATTNVVFISTGIFNVTHLIENIKFAYLFSYSVCPHYALLLSSLGANGKVLFCRLPIIDRFHVKTNTHESWSQLFVKLAIPTLIELPLNLSKNNLKFFAKDLSKGVGRPLKILSEVMPFYEHKSMYELNYYYHQMCERQPYKMLGYKIEYLLSKLILNIKPFARLFIILNNKIRLSRGKSKINDNMFNRI